jgi:hypothetical protein
VSDNSFSRDALAYAYHVLLAATNRLEEAGFKKYAQGAAALRDEVKTTLDFGDDLGRRMHPDPAYTAYLASLTERQCECCGERFTPKRKPDARLCPVCAVEEAGHATPYYWITNDRHGNPLPKRRAFVCLLGDEGERFVDVISRCVYASEPEARAALSGEGKPC